MLKVAIIGFGGIAKSEHFPAYCKLEKEGSVRITAICGSHPERFEESAQINIGSAEIKLDPSTARYSDWREMLKKEDLDLVDICLPTWLHAETVIAALDAGCHVLCEKPMSLNYADCERMLEAARRNGRMLMIGQCLRFEPEYVYLREMYASGVLGKPLAGFFRRLSPPPLWSSGNWLLKMDRSGGCVTDMHIHDLDFVRSLFGEPQTVSCFTQDVDGDRDIAYSTLRYPDFAMLVVGDWSQEGLPFSSEYNVSFEKATVSCVNGKVTVCMRGKEPFCPEITPLDPYEEEIAYLVHLIENGAPNTQNPPESAALSVKLANTLVQSADLGGQLLPFCP